MRQGLCRRARPARAFRVARNVVGRRLICYMMKFGPWLLDIWVLGQGEWLWRNIDQLQGCA